MRQCQLIRLLLLEFAGSRADRKAARMWSGCEGCVAPPIQEMMLAVALLNVCSVYPHFG